MVRAPDRGSGCYDHRQMGHGDDDLYFGRAVSRHCPCDRVHEHVFFKEAHFDMMIAMVRHHNYESAVKDALFCLSFFAEWIVFLFLAPISNLIGNRFETSPHQGYW